MLKVTLSQANLELRAISKAQDVDKTECRNVDIRRGQGWGSFFHVVAVLQTQVFSAQFGN